MRIHGNIKILSLFMDGMLDKGLAEKVETHVKICSGCRATLENMKKTRRCLSEEDSMEPPPYLERKIMDSLFTREKRSLPFKKFSLAAGYVALILLFSFIAVSRFKTGIKLASAPEGHLATEVKEAGGSLPGNGPRKELKEEAGFLGKVAEEEKPLEGKQEELPSSEKPVSVAKSEKTLFSKTSGASGDAVLDIAAETRTERKESMEAPAKTGAGGEKGNTAVFSAGREPAGSAPAIKSAPLDELSAKKVLDVKDAPSPIIIREAEEWHRIWQVQNAAQNLSLELPEVDFSKKMVVAVPSKRNDREYAVVNTVEENDRVILQYREYPLQKRPHPPYQLNIVSNKASVELEKID